MSISVVDRGSLDPLPEQVDLNILHPDMSFIVNQLGAIWWELAEPRHGGPNA